MADPTGYVNFADFLGLNDEAGKSMLDSQMSELERLRQAREAASDARFTAAKHGADAYAASGERERAALSSYGDFMKKMNDPKGRMELMEQTYGKGRVSALDAALAGAGSGAARIRDAQKGFEDAQHDAEWRGKRDVGRAGKYQQQRDDYAAQDAAYEKSAQDARDAREKDRLGREYALSEFDDDVRDSGFAGLGESTKGMSRRDRELALNRMTRGLGSKIWTRPDGSINWDVYHAQRGIQRAGRSATEANVRKGDYISQATSPLPSGQRAQSWGSFYSSNRKK